MKRDKIKLKTLFSIFNTSLLIIWCIILHTYIKLQWLSVHSENIVSFWLNFFSSIVHACLPFLSSRFLLLCHR